MKIMMLALALVGINLVERALGSSFEDQFHGRLMEVGWKQSLIELDRYSVSEKRYILERAILAFGSDYIPRQPARQKSFEKAQTTLLSIPGHAKYYQDRIEAMRDEVLAYSKKSDEEIMKMQDEGLEVTDDSTYDSYCVNAFRTLTHLPSAETVGVLGYYLNDPIGRDGKTLLGRNRSNPGDDFLPRPIHSEQAAKAIRSLGIEHPPFKAPVGREHEFLSEGEVDAWKAWWNEVKDGKRTYRFIGSSIEYGADGLASKEVIERATMNRKRDEERSIGKRSPNLASESAVVIPQLSKPASIAGILAACALVAGAVWYFLRGRRRA